MRRRLASDGYLIVPNSIDLPALAALEGQISSLFDAFDDLPDGVPKRLSRTGCDALEVNHLFTLLPALLGGQVVARIRELCAEVLGGQVRMVYAHAILKPPHGGAAVLAHQDIAYDGDDTNGADRYTVWLPFRDTSVDSGTLFYFTGSHRAGGRPHRLEDGVRSVIRRPRTLWRPKAAQISRGGFALHSSAIVHGSYPNRGERPRLAMSLRLRAS
jgi:hypothetical protein